MQTLSSVGMQPGLGELELAAKAMEMTARFAMVSVVVAFVAIGYLAITLDRRREGSPSRDDTQVGIKLVLWGLVVIGVMFAALGAEGLLAFVLGGFKGGWRTMREPLATLIAGGAVVAAIWTLLLPRTNNVERPQVERFAVGLLGTAFGAMAVVGLASFLERLLAGDRWAEIASALAATGVSGGIGALAAIRLGAMSGWRAAPPRVPQMPMAPPMAPPMGQPMPPQGMPPLGGGYPPAGGVPPQGGWPQGGAGGGQAPPQGGGWPPQGGGWPQQ